MIALLACLAASASDFVRTTAGANAAWSPSAGAGDVDLLVGERFRVTAVDGEALDVRFLGDARFTIDPNGVPTLEYHRVSQLGSTLESDAWTIDLGRHPVRHGGPRLVDGAQVLATPGYGEVGAWAGLAPDLFTTLPRVRPGGGPILAWNRTSLGGSLVGEALFSDAGELDRAGFLATARASRDRLVDAFGRLDLELAGTPHLADAQALVVVRPAATTRVEVLYNAFSSLRYQRTQGLDPTLQRFEQRLLDLGVELGIQQDTVDPTVNHLLGGGVRWRARGEGVQPLAGINTRYRYHPNPLNNFVRVTPHAGVGLPAAGWLELVADGSYIEVDGSRRGDAGMTGYWEPNDSLVGLDASARVLVNPRDYGGAPGFYGDVFADVFLPSDLLLIGGVSALSTPAEGFADASIGAFLRVTHAFRPAGRSAAAPPPLGTPTAVPR